MKDIDFIIEWKEIDLIFLFVLENEQETRLIVYRDQRLLSVELQHLQKSIGHLICFTSITSTSTNVEIALQYAGHSEEQSMYQSVIYEIHIDLSELEGNVSPYADISDVSYIPDEDEVLLCMETVMYIERAFVRVPMI